MQTWPELAKIPIAAPGAVLPMSTSGRTITGDLPPSSSVTRFSVSVAVRLMILASSGEPVEATVSTSGGPTRRAPCGMAEAGEEFDHAGGAARLGDAVGEPERGQRRLLGGLQDHGAAGGERGRDLLRRHPQREVPRPDLRAAP